MQDDDFDGGMGIPDDELGGGAGEGEMGDAAAGGGDMEGEEAGGGDTGRRSGGARARKSSVCSATSSGGTSLTLPLHRCSALR